MQIAARANERWIFSLLYFPNSLFFSGVRFFFCILVFVFGKPIWRPRCLPTLGWNGFQLRDVVAASDVVDVAGAAGVVAAVGAARNSIKLINEASESSREARQGNMACHLKISFRYNFLFPACQTARQASPKGAPTLDENVREWP